jgi:CHU_C Type IX secretion signal domain
MKYVIIFLAILPVLTGSAQMVIGPNSTVKVSGTMVVNGAIDNRSNSSELIAADISLTGGDQALTTVSPVVLNSLTVDGGGTKTIQGTWEVQTTFDLINGLVTVVPGAKLAYSGTEPLTGSADSYVNGQLYYRGSGQLFFPIGTSALYVPVTINNASDQEYGIQVVASDPAFALPPGVTAGFTEHYWLFTVAPATDVSLSTNGMDAFLQQGGAPIVLEAAATGGVATTLSGTVADNFVTSAQAVSQVVVGVGLQPEFTVIIHDMITPFTADGVNDKLFIENIDLTTSNHVTLIDRYGVVVSEWDGYSNEIEYDFQRFSPGNYICVVEYVPTGSTVKAVAKGNVTILKTK